MQAKLLAIYLLSIYFISIKTIDVSTIEEFYKVVGKARAGQVIALAPQVFNFSEVERTSDFQFNADGTKSSPIRLTAQDPDHPPTLRDFHLHVTGNYWVIENIKIAHGRITLDNANHNTFRNVEIYSTTAGAITVRYGSSYNLFQNCYIHNTGCGNLIYGDAIDIGTPHTEKTTADNHKADYNIIEGYVFRQISSEPIRIREYTIGNEVVGNAFYGNGINGKNECDNFITISGSDNYIHNNVAYKNQNQNITTAFEVKKFAEDTGDGNKLENNILFMDRPYAENKNEKRMYVVDGVDAQFSDKNNKVDYGERLLDANSEVIINDIFELSIYY